MPPTRNGWSSGFACWSGSSPTRASTSPTRSSGFATGRLTEVETEGGAFVRDPFMMVVLIVLIVTVGNIVRAKMGIRRSRRGEEVAIGDPAETRALREEVRQLKDRIQVLER